MSFLWIFSAVFALFLDIFEASQSLNHFGFSLDDDDSKDESYVPTESDATNSGHPSEGGDELSEVEGDQSQSLEGTHGTAIPSGMLCYFASHPFCLRNVSL